MGTTDYTSYKVAEQGMAKIPCNVVGEIWYNDLKNADTFYTKLTVINIMALLDANSGGLHALDMITLHTDMMQYYVQVDGIPQFIVMMEYAQKKAERAGMTIANVKLVMMSLQLSLQLNTSHVKLMIGKAFRPCPVHGKLARWHSALPI
jgi:hypothetical protein